MKKNKLLSLSAAVAALLSSSAVNAIINEQSNPIQSNDTKNNLQSYEPDKSFAVTYEDGQVHDFVLENSEDGLSHLALHSSHSSHGSHRSHSSHRSGY